MLLIFTERLQPKIITDTKGRFRILTDNSCHGCTRQRGETYPAGTRLNLG